MSGYLTSKLIQSNKSYSHCSFINNCVGVRNIRPFVGLIFSAFALSVELSLLTLYYYLTFDPLLQPGLDYTTNPITSWALLLSLLV